MHVHASLSQSSLSMPNSEHLSKLCSSHIFLYASCMSVCLLRVRLSPVRRYVYCMSIHLLYVPPICPSVSCTCPFFVCPPTTAMPIRLQYTRLCMPVCTPSLSFHLMFLCMSVYHLYVCSFSVCPTRSCMSAHRLYAHPPLVCPSTF